MNEADTCRTLVRPKLEAAGWDGNKHFYSEQTPFTDGRIVVPGGKPRRLKKKYSDFLLRYTRDLTLGVVEAKSDKRPAGDGLQQAKDYAEILGLKFAYATNGTGIIEYDFFTSLETELNRFPTPDELWFRYQQGQGLVTATANALLAPFFHQPGREPRYYQRIAIQRAVEAILGGKRRALLTMATGTGKTVVAFQICWKLWSAAWNAKGDHRKPRILFLADRNVLVDDPKDKTFAPFGDARHKIEGGNAIKSREMYFATYQSIAQDERRPGRSNEEKAEGGWARTVLGDVITLATDPVKVDTSISYLNLGIYSFGRGLFKKPPIDGMATSASTVFRVRAGQFVYSRLFAFEGAYGIVPDHMDGHFVSNEYPVFNCDPDRVRPEFLEAYFKSPRIWQLVATGSKGLGDRRQRVHPEQVLRHSLWLPPRSWQQTIADIRLRLLECHSSAEMIDSDLAAFLPLVLSRAFNREL